MFILIFGLEKQNNNAPLQQHKPNKYSDIFVSCVGGFYYEQQ